jgi:hypothetical protein
LGAGFGGAAAGLGARFTVVVVCRATVVGGAVVVARTRAASGVYVAEASVVGGAGASVVAGAAAWSSADDGSGAEADTVSAAPRT